MVSELEGEKGRKVILYPIVEIEMERVAYREEGEDECKLSSIGHFDISHLEESGLVDHPDTREGSTDDGLTEDLGTPRRDDREIPTKAHICDDVILRDAQIDLDALTTMTIFFSISYRRMRDATLVSRRVCTLQKVCIIHRREHR